MASLDIALDALAMTDGASSPISEPSTHGLIAGAVSLVLVAIRRLRRQA